MIECLAINRRNFLRHTLQIQELNEVNVWNLTIWSIIIRLFFLTGVAVARIGI